MLQKCRNIFKSVYHLWWGVCTCSLAEDKIRQRSGAMEAGSGGIKLNYKVDVLNNIHTIRRENCRFV